MSTVVEATVAEAEAPKPHWFRLDNPPIQLMIVTVGTVYLLCARWAMKDHALEKKIAAIEAEKAAAHAPVSTPVSRAVRALPPTPEIALGRARGGDGAASSANAALRGGAAPRQSPLCPTLTRRCCARRFMRRRRRMPTRRPPLPPPLRLP